MRNTDTNYRLAGVFSSLIIYAGVFSLIPELLDDVTFSQQFLWQYNLLLSLACVLVMCGFFCNDKWLRYTLFLRIGIACLIGYTTHSHPFISALMLIGIFQEAGFRQKPLWTGSIILVSMALLIPVLLMDQVIFWVKTPGMSLDAFLVFLSLSIPVELLALGLSFMMRRERSWRSSVDRLDFAVSRLADVNLGYQGYAQEVRDLSIAEERLRVSREIHDTVGYSLTNIRVMLEAASIQMPVKPEETIRLINQSMEEASECLEQTRQTMRQLRSREEPGLSGLVALQRLIRAFSDVSGIKVHTQYGNVPVQWPLPVEKAVYRMIQEGMTNSFRHGMASDIMIYLWQDKDTLNVSISDNGFGSGEIKEGIGLSGMRERITAMGGTFQVKRRSDGFEVNALIPLQGKQ